MGFYLAFTILLIVGLAFMKGARTNGRG